MKPKYFFTVGWINRSNGKSAMVLAESADDSIHWRYKGSNRRYSNTRTDFLRKFYNAIQDPEDKAGAERATPLTLPYGGVPTSDKRQPHGCRAASFAFFREVAKQLGIPKDQYELRCSACGDWGETYFHSETFYVQVNFDRPRTDPLGLLYRTCKSRKDYVGGRNLWLRVDEATLGNVVAALRGLGLPHPKWTTPSSG